MQPGDATTSDEFRKKLIEKIVLVLKSGSDEECAICLDQLKTPVITHCAHVFCRPCIEAVINAEKVSTQFFLFLVLGQIVLYCKNVLLLLLSLLLLFIHSFIPETYIAPLQDTTT